MPENIIKSTNTAPPAYSPVFNFSLRSKYIFLAIIGFVFYANSIPNKYAFDDVMAIENNAYVQMGLKGIPKILTNDTWASYLTGYGADMTKRLSGAKRYRPLSEIIFAMVQQVFGGSTLLPYFYHLVNVLAYVACIFAIFYFLEKFLLVKTPGGSEIAFLSTFLFAIHPIHTEVVANIKSLDEILSMLFIMFTFIFSLKYIRAKQAKYLLIGTVSFFLALLSKEYAVTLLLFIPFLFYLLEGKKLSSVIKASIPYYIIFFVYLSLRYNAVGLFNYSKIEDTNLLTNPYYYATHVQKMATEWFVLARYLGLLFFPYPLSYDYSYNQIPYHNFSDISVFFSILTYLGVFAWGVKLTLKKRILSFAVFFFLLNVLLISNLLFAIGPTMGERLVFHSSLGFVIILAYYIINATLKMAILTRKILLIGIISVIGFVSFGEIVIRNSQWKNDTSLDIHDVSVVPNSFLANTNAGLCYLMLSERKENTTEEIVKYHDSTRKYFFRSLNIYSVGFTYLDLGFFYYDQGLLDSAKLCWNIAEKINPYQPGLKADYAMLEKQYFYKGVRLAMKTDKLPEGIIDIKKALLLDSTNASIWYNLGVAYYRIREYDSAKYALMKTLQYKPDSMDAINTKKDLKVLSQMK